MTKIPGLSEAWLWSAIDSEDETDRYLAEGLAKRKRDRRSKDSDEHSAVVLGVNEGVLAGETDVEVVETSDSEELEEIAMREAARKRARAKYLSKSST